MTFGEKLKHIRKEVLRMTQKELAESLGVRQSAITSIEKGVHKSASFDLFRQLVIVHYVNPMYFILDKGEPPILKGNREKALVQKVSKYEKLIDELHQVKKG